MKLSKRVKVWIDSNQWRHIMAHPYTYRLRRHERRELAHYAEIFDKLFVDF